MPGTWSIVEHLLLVLSVIAAAAAAAAAAVVVVTAVATVAAAIATVHAVVAAWCFCHMVCSRVKLGITHSSAKCITVGHASDADIASASEGMGLQDSCKCSCAWLIMHSAQHVNQCLERQICIRHLWSTRSCRPPSAVLTVPQPLAIALIIVAG